MSISEIKKKIAEETNPDILAYLGEVLTAESEYIKERNEYIRSLYRH